MNAQSRMATLWGVLFPILALVAFVILLNLGRGAPKASAVTPAQASSSQSAAQGDTTMAGNTASNSATSNGSETAQGGTQASSGQGSGGASSSSTPSASQPSSTPASGAAASTGSSSTSSSTSQSTGGASGGTTSSAGTAANTAGTATQASADGAQVFSSNCASCHGQAGAGVPGAFPPLAGNPAILGSETYVSDVLLYGLQGQIQVKGQTYNGVMPAWAGTLSDDQIAAVLTHIRSSWGNKAPAVTAATVKTERATTKTAAQVLAERPQ